MIFRLVLVMAFVSGFVSLSYEVLWARMFSWSTAGAASSFPMLLGLFLAGLAVGAKWSKRFSHGQPTHSTSALRAVAAFFAASALAGWLVIPAMAAMLSLHANIPGYTALYFVFLAACLSGAQLPLLMHYGIPADARVGANLSYVYVANILGAVTGSMLTGFFWLDHASTGSIITVLTCGSLSLAYALWASTRPDAKRLGMGGAVLLALIGLTVLAQPFLYGQVLEKLFYGAKFDGQRFKYIVENKSGFIAVDDNDVAYGGGAYDGTFSVDLINDVNGAARPFSLSAFHPAPKSILVVGMATGSWARVLAAHPQLERMVIVEINGGYYDLIKKYPDAAKLLDNPKIEHVADDGRRWMHAHDEKFDAIVINASFHHRGFMTTLLSQEFITMVKDHLHPNGVLMLNTTGSERVLKTVCEVMPNCVAYLRSAIASPSPLDIDPERLRDVLTHYQLDAHPILDEKRPDHVAKLEEIIEEIRTQSGNFKSHETVMKLTKDAEIITDDNMGHEWQFSILGL
ncbi:MAG: methyltransferase domain-containing protein [bacterium]